MKKSLFIALAIFFLCSYLPWSAIPGKAVDSERHTSSGSCEYPDTANKTKIKIVSWNLQTFFDSHTEGNEYPQFIKSEKWGKDAYIQRLERLCTVIKKLDADVFVMEEIENAAILYDISNRLAGNWQSKKNYSYGCFAKAKNSSIGCAVISRLPLKELKIHSLMIQTESYEQPSLRPLMELTVLKKEKSKTHSLKLFVNHWKSMSGGQAQSEKWRKWQESVLAFNLSKACESASIPAHKVLECAILACGDFNKNIQDFTFDAENNILLNYAAADKSKVLKKHVKVYSPWILEDGTIRQTGSYYFKQKWNYLDHFFTYPAATIKSFMAENNSPWADKNGIPIGYKLFTGSGYSDHLPVSCIVEF